jgi:hypothetical protein
MVAESNERSAREVIADALIPPGPEWALRRMRYIVLGDDRAVLDFLPTRGCAGSPSLPLSERGSQTESGSADVLSLEQHRPR